MRLSKLSVISLLSLSFAVACTRPDRNAGTDEASFNIESLKGSGSPGRIDPNNPLKVPDEIIFNFSACIEERTSRQPLRSQLFAVFNPDTQTTVDVKTEKEKGCFTWNEPIKYNHYAAKSGWIVLTRYIEGRGTNSGRRKIEIAVNPWAVGSKKRDNRPEVVDMRQGVDGFKPSAGEIFDAKEAKAALNGSIQGAADLMIYGVKIRSIPQGEGEGWVTLLIEVEMEPKIHTKTANNDDEYEEIKDGDFEVQAQILAADAGDKMDRRVLLTSGETFVIGKARDGKLKAEIKISQDRRVIQGNLEMALKVSPHLINKKDYSNVKPFEGLFRFGPGTQIDDHSGTLANACLESGNCSFDKIIESASNYQDLVDKGYILKNDRYVFSKMEFRFTSVLPGETATRRTVAYAASTCIKDRQTGKPLADTPMIIRYTKITSNKEQDADRPLPKPIYRKTDESGCLNWSSQIFHKYYKPEKYVENTISIERESGFKREFKFYLNPWDDKFTFGWDARELDPKFFESIQNRAKPPSRFFLSDFGYHTVRFLYNIDPYMELEVKKTVLMELRPHVLRYSGIINARKMTESLRDGIYLMKVGIQKSYLDPRDNSGWMLRNTPEMRAKLEHRGGAALAAREFVTTNMALVRVVDGVIVYPIELTMRDLRLMRNRSNFMIELETVDERLIQAFHVFKKHATTNKQLEEQLEDFKKTVGDKSLADVRTELGGEVPEALRETIKQRDELASSPQKLKAYEDLRSKVVEVQDLVGHQVDILRRRLEGKGPIGHYLSGADESITSDFILDDEKRLINDNFQIDQNLLEGLQSALKVNDFSEVTLPRKEEIDLNLFVEQDSGLEKRTFVGPLIFLSNGYSDSVRATDNLDEACPPKEGKDTLERSKEALALKKLEYDEIQAAREKFEGKRQNNAFDYDKYFGANGGQNIKYLLNPFYGSLSHLCYKHVDDLIEKQKNLDHEWEQRYTAISLKYNFLTSWPVDLDYVSLTGEKLKRVKSGCLKKNLRYGPARHRDVNDCLEETDELTSSAGDILADLNQNLDGANKKTEVRNTLSSVLGKTVSNYIGIEAHPVVNQWTAQDLSTLFYGEDSVGVLDENTKRAMKETRTSGICNLLAYRISRNLIDNKLTSKTQEEIVPALGAVCRGTDGLIHDIKLHVSKTGEYTFLGGLNLNFNVGESFGVGTSYNWSAGFEWMDLLGSLAGTTKGIGDIASNAGKAGVKSAADRVGSRASLGSSIIKPLSLKVGSSMGSSEGTSVSESTYLVSQLAKFELKLMSYERCAVVGLSDDAIRTLAGELGDTSLGRAIGLTSINFTDEKVLRVLHRGLMVCEGSEKKNKPIDVKEIYFYLTQHFTEGDMLDQADLYNHPWLLAMRGVRDFTMFVKKIRAQDTVSFGNFTDSVLGTGEKHKVAWALEHMASLYKNKLPSFPGFYSLLDKQEDIAAFPLESGFKFSKDEQDVKGEVIRRQLEMPKPRRSSQDQ